MTDIALDEKAFGTPIAEPDDMQWHVDRMDSIVRDLWAANDIDLHMCNDTVKRNQSGLLHDIRNSWRIVRRALATPSPSQVAPQPQASEAQQPTAFIQKEVLDVLMKDKTATGSVSSGLLRKPFGNPVPLYASPQPANPAQVTDACWVWRGTLFDAGYGAFQENGKTLRAHRVIYELVRGAIPDSLVLDHLCRNRACVNPWHLEPVSLVENIMRGESFSAQNARKTHCQNGHEFTPENTRQYQNRRICIECSREETRKRMRIMRAKKRAK